MKQICVYLRLDKIYVCTNSRTTSGLWIGNGPNFVLDTNDLDQIGATVLKALEASLDQIPHPAQSEWKKILLPLLDLAKVKSWNIFAKSSKCVLLTLENENLRLLPTYNSEKEGFKFLDEKRILTNMEPENITTTLLKAFDLCE